jgi:tryptophan-rich sensory protein
MMKRGLDKLFNLLLCLLIVSVVAFIGGLFTKIDAWYYSVRPAITPPTWVFPIVWNFIFLTIAISLYLVLNKCEGKRGCSMLWLFGANLLLNVLWSFFYFTLHSPVLAFIDIILLFASILLLIYKSSKVSRAAAILLIPYLVWVAFASVLNALSI